MMKVNEVSNLTGVSKRTLQYYDDAGVLSTKRTPEGHRVYDREALERIWRILICKEMGFSLKEIRIMAEESQGQPFPTERQSKLLNGRMSAIRSQMSFISWVLANGFPKRPPADDKTPYVTRIARMRSRLQAVYGKESLK